jgi:hypothetical protein
MCATPLAIGTCDVYGFELVLGIAQQIQQFDGICEVLFERNFPNSLVHGQKLVHAFQRLLKVHLL